MAWSRLAGDRFTLTQAGAGRPWLPCSNGNSPGPRRGTGVLQQICGSIITSPIETSAVIQELLESIHTRHVGTDTGAVADYIPELARADPNHFGIVLATADGRIYAVGDTDVPFTIQSISKPFSYGLALKLLGREQMQRKVGVEPSGEAFNAISLDPTSGIPRNPMINAGAIATTSQISHRIGDDAERLLLEFFSDLAGRPLGIDQAVYRSECDSGHRNRAISHLLRNANVIEADPEVGLDLYFRQCAISVTCRDLAVMAATLACQGCNPLSGATILDAGIVTRMLALMGTCGMYDYAGHWLYDVGMPAKSGVGGGVMAVVPGRLGIATFSPRLDAYGNSARGIAVCEELSERLGLHLYNQNPGLTAPIRRSSNATFRQSRRLRSGLEGGQLAALSPQLRILHVQGVIDFTDCELLLAELQQISQEARVILLDLAHVTDVLPQCWPLLAAEIELLRHHSIPTVLSRSQHLPEAGALGLGPCFSNFDEAMEAAENLLLSGSLEILPDDSDQPSWIDSLSEADQALIRPLLELRQLGAGEALIRRGETGDSLFIAQAGLYAATVNLQELDGRRRPTRMATFAPGMSFGEIAFLSGLPRSADVVCTTGGSCWELRRAAFDDLRQHHPQTAIQLLLALANDLGAKLGRTIVKLSLMEQL